MVSEQRIEWYYRMPLKEFIRLYKANKYPWYYCIEGDSDPYPGFTRGSSTTTIPKKYYNCPVTDVTHTYFMGDIVTVYIECDSVDKADLKSSSTKKRTVKKKSRR